MASRLRMPILACALLPAALAHSPAAMAEDADHALIREVNAYRADHGRAPLRESRRLDRSSLRQARRIARSGTPRHGSLRGDMRRFRRVGEVIEWHEGSARPRAAMTSWSRSRSHRRVLLRRGMDYVGVGRAVGRVNGVRCTIWVARVGAR